MRNILIALILLLSFSGCEDKEKQALHDAKIAQEAKTQLLVELKVKEEARIKVESMKKDRLSSVGISLDNDTIIIDTNRTRDFFQNIGKNIEEKLQKITKDLERGMMDDNQTGIKISEEHINIDLNKTRDFLNSWGKKMQSLIKEVDTIAKEMDIQAQ